MRNLGSFGELREEADDVCLDYFGETIRANPDLSQLDYVDFLDEHGSVEVTDTSASTFVKRFARLCVHGEDFDLFWSTAKKNRQHISDIFPVLHAIVEAVTDRPTTQPSDSSDGQETTAPSFESAAAQRAMAQLKGRPDLQLMVVRAEEARQAV